MTFWLHCGIFLCSDLLSPADEVAEEVSDAVETAEDKGNMHLTPAQVRHVTGEAS